MSYTVVWEPDARSELHQVWATAPNPPAVRTAASRAEHTLAADPVGSGIPLSEGLWRAVFPPIVIYYTIDSNQQSVVISNVAHTA